MTNELVESVIEDPHISTIPERKGLYARYFRPTATTKTEAIKSTDDMAIAKDNVLHPAI
jgi:hypothetical protein